MSLNGVDVSGGNMSPATFNPPAACIGNSAVASSPTSPIDAEKSEQQHTAPYWQAAGSAIVAQSANVFIVRGTTGELLSVDAMVDTIATGADRTVTIDIKRSTAGGAFATMLNTTIVF